MAYVVLDTETTGLPKTRASPTKDNLSCWDGCRVLSMAVIKYSGRGREHFRFYDLVYPDTFQVAATEIHGITQQDAETQGKPFCELFDRLRECFKFSNVVVGHNLKFDLDVIRAEAIRRNIDHAFLDTLLPVCTLDMTKKIFGKPMKLTVLYKEIFGRDFEGAHNALADTLACNDVYRHLLDDPRTYKNINIKKVILKASDVAACIGMHGFKKPQEVIEELWSKYSPQTFKGKTKDDIARELIATSPIAADILKSVEVCRPHNSKDVMNQLGVFVSKLETEKKFTPYQFYDVKDYLRKVLFTNHGTHSEKKTADLDAADLREDDTFYTFDVCTIKDTLYQIVGRIDRFEIRSDGSKVLVEIKNRTKALFNTVRTYEEVQVQTYLQMVNLPQARLIEQYNNERKSYLITKDDDLWKNTVVPKLENFCKIFHNALTNA